MDFAPSRPVTKSFIFLDDVLSQSHPGGDWPASSVNGQVIDLAMDPDIVNDPRYNAYLKESLLEVPTISLVTDNADMFSPSSGIYVNAYSHGEQWERECSLELINPDQSQGFQVNAGVRIRGGAQPSGRQSEACIPPVFQKGVRSGQTCLIRFLETRASLNLTRLTCGQSRIIRGAWTETSIILS